MPAQTGTTFTQTRFDSLPLHPDVLKGLSEAGFEHCTPIQAQSLPLVLEGYDVAGQGQTGTGKTGAFLVACFNHLLTREPLIKEQDQLRSLILAPTRELAIQIHRDAIQLGSHTGLRFGLAYGGIDYAKQRDQLAKGIDILIGTPGRIIDYFKQGVFKLKYVQVTILDEADRMFDLGFIKDIRYLLRRMPPPQSRLNLLFSATLSYRVTELAYEHMNDPQRVEVEAEQMTADRVDQQVFYPSNNEKIPLLIGQLRAINPDRTMVFCNTKHVVEKVAAFLNANGFEAAVLSGDVRQKKRQTLLKRFHDGQIAVLVATDVAARGLHIPDVSHVFNFALPQDPEDYVHRIGRTARLGSKGDAISFACEDYAFSLPDIEEYVGMKIPTVAIDGALAEDLKRPEKPRRPRNSKKTSNAKPAGGNKNNNRNRRRRRPKKPNTDKGSEPNSS